MNSTNEKTYIFIPGGWHGAWAFDPLIERLKALQKKCVALTLPGLEASPVAHPKPINLDTHIQFVIEFIKQEKLTDIILCAHSYGGLVITGVADKIPQNIKALVYIDAYVPESGDSCWSLTSDVYRKLFAAGANKDGFTVAVPQGTDERRRPQPLATFMQGIQLTGRQAQIKNRSFIYMSGWEGTPFTGLFERLKNFDDWQTTSIHCVHNVMRENPDELTNVLCRLEKRYII